MCILIPPLPVLRDQIRRSQRTEAQLAGRVGRGAQSQFCGTDQGARLLGRYVAELDQGDGQVRVETMERIDLEPDGWMAEWTVA